MARQTGDVEKVTRILNCIDDWCWAHRDGNGTLNNRAVQKRITEAFWRMANA